jgi:hypothetical protein
MGTYDGWIPLRGRDKKFSSKKVVKKLLLDPFRGELGLCEIFGIVTLPDNSKCLSIRAKPTEFEEFWADEYGAHIQPPNVLWFIDDQIFEVASMLGIEDVTTENVDKLITEYLKTHTESWDNLWGEFVKEVEEYRKTLA